MTFERSGRNRYYRLASAEVAEVMETLARIAPARPVRSLNQAMHTDAIRRARSCYDHLAGRLGVALWDATQADALVERDRPENDRRRHEAGDSDARRLPRDGTGASWSRSEWRSSPPAAGRSFAPASTGARGGRI